MWRKSLVTPRAVTNPMTPSRVSILIIPSEINNLIRTMRGRNSIRPQTVSDFNWPKMVLNLVRPRKNFCSIRSGTISNLMIIRRVSNLTEPSNRYILIMPRRASNLLKMWRLFIPLQTRKVILSLKTGNKTKVILTRSISNLRTQIG